MPPDTAGSPGQDRIQGSAASRLRGHDPDACSFLRCQACDLVLSMEREASLPAEKCVGDVTAVAEVTVRHQVSCSMCGVIDVLASPEEADSVAHSHVEDHHADGEEAAHVDY